MSEALEPDLSRLDFHSHLIDYGDDLPAIMLRQFKSCAKGLHSRLKNQTTDLKLSALHEAMAKALGFGNFHAMQIVLSKARAGLSASPTSTKAEWIQSNSASVDSMNALFCLIKDAERISRMDTPAASVSRFLSRVAEHCSLDLDRVSLAYEQTLSKEQGQWLLPPVLLSYALPLARVDLEEGVLDKFVDVLIARHGFKTLGRQAVKDLLAIGFGYESWTRMQQREATKIAGQLELPAKEHEIEAVISWRMFLASNLSLPDICAAVYAGWNFSSLSLRQLCASSSVRGDDRRAWLGLAKKRMPGYQRESNTGFSRSQLLEDGRLYLPYRAELAFEAANLCWSESSKIHAPDLIERIRTEAPTDVENALLFSWATHVWPVGLQPVSYVSADGGTIGYGWFWQEIGAYHAHVFRTPEDHLRSAEALWHRQPTHPYRCTDLPPTLKAVDFDNPWDLRVLSMSGYPDPTSPDRDCGGVGLVTRVRENRSSESWFDALTSKDGQLCQERSFDLDGEPWTALSPQLKWQEIDGTLGIKLTPIDHIESIEEWDWMKAKIPFALSTEEFVGQCGFIDAIGKATQRLMADHQTVAQPYVSDVNRLFNETVGIARPIHSEAFNELLQRDFGMGLEVSSWGRRAISVYPELEVLGINMCADYAFSFFGEEENKIRCNDTRDPLFLGYCSLRNLGMVPNMYGYQSEWTGALSVLLAHWKAQPDCLRTTPGKLAVMEGLDRIFQAITTSDKRCSELDTSLEKSRLEFIGAIAPANAKMRT